MPRICTVCTHPERAAIDQALVAGSGSIRGIARQYSVGSDALERHRARHLTGALAAAASRRDSQDDSLLDRIQRSYERAERLYGIAENILERCQEDHLSLKAINSCCTVLEQSRKWCELLAELTGALKAHNAQQVTVTVQYVDTGINGGRATTLLQ